MHQVVDEEARRPTIALLEPDPFLRDVLDNALTDTGYAVVAPALSEHRRPHLPDQSIDLAVIATEMPPAHLTTFVHQAATAKQAPPPIIFVGTRAPPVSMPAMAFLPKSARQ